MIRRRNSAGYGPLVLGILNTSRVSRKVSTKSGQVQTIVMEYRKRKNSDTWHWCKNCTNWPTSDYDVRYTKPTTGELDDECLAKDRAGNCQT